MSFYPADVTVQDLYASSIIKHHELGSVQNFKTAHGMVEAIYVKNVNAASILPGLAVAQQYGLQGGAYGVDTAAINNVSAARNPGHVLGVICASMQGTATSLGGGGYAWAAFRGPITNAWLAASVVSNAKTLVSVNSLAQLALSVTSQGSVVTLLGPHAIGIVGASDSTVSRPSASSGVAACFVQLLWK